MTGAQIFVIEPVIIMFIVGACFVFERQVVRLVKMIEGLSARALGLGMILIALAFGVLIWLDPYDPGRP